MAVIVDSLPLAVAARLRVARFRSAHGFRRRVGRSARRRCTAASASGRTMGGVCSRSPVPARTGYTY